MYAARHPRPVIVVLAPLFCMGLFHATRKRLIVSWCALIGIVGLIVLVRQLDQPWRGIVDGGVVAGLGWGLVAMLWFMVRALLGHPMPVPADVPEDALPVAGMALEPRADAPERG
jgi:apolipoprotein N-acyltransferase